MNRFFWIRLRIILLQTKWAFLLIGLWFAAGTFVFFKVEHLPLREAFLDAVYLHESRGPFWDLYSFWGQCLVFGILVSAFVLQGLQRYDPKEGCRMLASGMKNHVVVIGHGHLGKRILAHLQNAGHPYALVEQDPLVVSDLVRKGQPVIVDDARTGTTLEAAGVERARLVVIASNNIETALLVTKRTRERNKTVPIIVRCFVDDFVEILESLGATSVISSSRSAFAEIAHLLEVPGASLK